MKGQKIFLALLIMIFSSSTYAASCGKGKITQVEEGYYNTDSLAIKIDYSVNTSSHAGTEAAGGNVLYKKDSLSESRFNGIRAIALSALVSGRIVDLYTHNASCADATQIRIY